MLKNLQQMPLKLHQKKKKAIQKTSWGTSDLIGNKIVNKITSIGLWSNPETASQTDEKSVEIPEGKYLFPERRQETNDEHRLMYDNIISKKT